MPKYQPWLDDSEQDHQALQDMPYRQLKDAVFQDGVVHIGGVVDLVCLPNTPPIYCQQSIQLLAIGDLSRKEGVLYHYTGALIDPLLSAMCDRITFEVRRDKSLSGGVFDVNRPTSNLQELTDDRISQGLYFLPLSRDSIKRFEGHPWMGNSWEPGYHPPMSVMSIEEEFYKSSPEETRAVLADRGWVAGTDIIEVIMYNGDQKKVYGFGMANRLFGLQYEYIQWKIRNADEIYQVPVTEEIRNNVFKHIMNPEDMRFE